MEYDNQYEGEEEVEELVMVWVDRERWGFMDVTEGAAKSFVCRLDFRVVEKGRSVDRLLFSLPSSHTVFFVSRYLAL